MNGQDLYERVSALLDIIRGPRRVPIEQAIAGFRAAEVLGRRPPGRRPPPGRANMRGFAFDQLSRMAEAVDLTILEFLDVIGLSTK